MRRKLYTVKPNPVAPNFSNLALRYCAHAPGSNPDAGITLSGSAVTGFVDLSGRGFHSNTQATGTKRPQKDTTNLLNGKQVVSCDNGDTILTTVGAGYLRQVLAGDNTIFAVARRTSASTIDYIYHFSASAGGRGYIRFDNDGVGDSHVRAQSRNSDANGIQITNSESNRHQLFTFMRRGATAALAVRGGELSTNQFGNSELSTDLLAMFSRADIDSVLNGHFAELLVYRGRLSRKKRRQVEIYLADYWGVYHPKANWIKSGAYTELQRALIHAWQLNKDDAFTASALNPFAIIVDATPTALGAVSSWFDYSGRSNPPLQGTGVRQPVNTDAVMGTKKGLLFDADDDALSSAAADAINDVFAAGGCYISVIKPTSTGEGGNPGRIIEKNSSTFLALQSASGGTCQVLFQQAFSTTNGVFRTTNRDVTLGTVNIVGVTYDASNVANVPSIYVNSLTGKAVTTTTTPVGSASTDAAVSLKFGNNNALDRTFDGYQGCHVILKSVPSAAKLSSIFTQLAALYGVPLT